MESAKQLLLVSAARLYSLGVDLEGAREKLRKYVEDGVPWSSPLMAQAYGDFMDLRGQFDRLEAQHLALRDQISPEK